MANDHTRRDAVSGSGDIAADWGPQGLQITDARPRPVWARITGVAGGTNRYSWVQINEADTTLPDWGSGFAMTGSTTVGQWPAYEVTGNGSVATGTKVQIWPSPGGQFWLFYSPGGSAPTATTAPATSTSISVDDTWVDITAASLTVPATGYYLFNWAYVGRANVTTGTPAKLLFQILSAGFKVAEREYTLHVTGEDVSFALACSKWEYLLSGTLKMQARRVSGVTWSSVDVYNTAGPGETFVQIVDF